MLASGVLRELYILAVVNTIFIFSLRRKLIPVILSLLFLFFLRNFYIVILFPVFVYFWNYSSRNRNIYSFLSGIVSLLIVMLAVLVKNSIYETSSADILLRVISAFTGLSVAAIDLGELFNENFVFKLERISLIHQCIVMAGLYLYIFLRGLRINYFLIVCFFVMLNLSLIYGYFLGYFVARTKIIIIWLVILYLSLDSNRGYREGLT